MNRKNRIKRENLFNQTNNKTTHTIMATYKKLTETDEYKALVATDESLQTQVTANAEAISKLSSSGSGGTTAEATTTTAGLMSAEDKAALDTLTSGQNTDYVSNIAITQEAAHPDWARFTVQKGNSVQYSFDLDNATTTVQGLMSAADKTSLDTLAGGTDSHYVTKMAVAQTRPYYVDITPYFGGVAGSKISIGTATESAAGVMTAGDKKKLNAYPDWDTLNARIAALEGS